MRLVMTLILTCLAMFGTANVIGQDGEAIKTFQAPVISERVYPSYSFNQVRKQQEGWVEINFMVDEAGKTFEPTVMDSMGPEVFQSKALEALEKTTFTPAMDAGTPVSSSTTLRYKFQIQEREKSARERFATYYKRFQRAMGRNDRETAEKLIGLMEDTGAMSLYEAAYLNLAKFNFAVEYGDSETQLKYLKRALFFEDDQTLETYLPVETELQLWPVLFALEANNKRFVEALATFEIIKQKNIVDAIDSLAPVVSEIETLRNDDRAFVISGKTDNVGRWGICLLKDEFYLDNAQATINEIKLRCSRKYIFFKYTAETKYHVPAEYGACNMELLGDADAAFDFVQL